MVFIYWGMIVMIRGFFLGQFKFAFIVFGYTGYQGKMRWDNGVHKCSASSISTKVWPNRVRNL